MPETDQRLAVLKYIADYREAFGYSPSMREIADDLEIASTSTVAFHLGILRARGLITQKDRTPRTIVLTQKGREEIA